eukprot:symbB.v1.2.003266.t2/scaffold117.1/size318901/5
MRAERAVKVGEDEISRLHEVEKTCRFEIEDLRVEFLEEELRKTRERMQNRRHNEAEDLREKTKKELMEYDWQERLQPELCQKLGVTRLPPVAPEVTLVEAALPAPLQRPSGDGDKSKTKTPNKTDGATRGPGTTTSALDDDDEEDSGAEEVIDGRTTHRIKGEKKKLEVSDFFDDLMEGFAEIWRLTVAGGHSFASCVRRVAYPLKVIADEELPPPPFYPQAKARPKRRPPSSIRRTTPPSRPMSRAASVPSVRSASRETMPVAMQHAVQYATRTATAVPARAAQ